MNPLYRWTPTPRLRNPIWLRDPRGLPLGLPIRGRASTPRVWTINRHMVFCPGNATSHILGALSGLISYTITIETNNIITVSAKMIQGVTSSASLRLIIVVNTKKKPPKPQKGRDRHMNVYSYVPQAVKNSWKIAEFAATLEKQKKEKTLPYFLRG